MRKSADAKKEFVETVTWNKNLAEGATLEGRYVSQDTFIGKFGETTKYVIEGNNGTTYGVYGSVSLNRQFAKIPEGSYVWITYKGQEPTKNGRTVNVFVVEYDDEQ